MSGKSDFSLHLTKLFAEIIKYKNDIKETWTNDLEELYRDLNDIMNIAEENEEIAKDMFNESVLSQYDNFASYIYMNTDIAKSLKHNEVSRVKASRASRKDIRCPNCNVKISSNAMLDDYKCVCGFEGEIEVKGKSSNTSVDNTKHTQKTIDKFIGLCNPTKTLQAITQTVVSWLTDRHFILEWLTYRGTLSEWLHKYSKVTGTTIVYDSIFSNDNIVLEHIPENYYSYEVFKLYTDELYNMLEYCNKLSTNCNNNIVSLEDKDIIKVCTNYMKEHNSLPEDSSTVYLYEDVKYGIGKFVNFLKLIYEPTSYPLKETIEKIFKCTIKAPGLMNDFVIIKNGINKFPAKFQYGQEYIYFIHHAFNVDYVSITSNDKQHIVNLIITFNNWCKQYNKDKYNKESNSPLLACTLQFILSLPYFKRYERLCNYLPKKDKNTVTNIRKYWLMFVSDNDCKVLRTYATTVDEIPFNETEERLEENEGVNIEDEGDVF